jgi:mannose-6-phosphate isomerase-like protein (cupin superfamily)
MSQHDLFSCALPACTSNLSVHFVEDREEKGARETGTTIKNGSVFRVIEFEPGVAPRNPRTDSIDYAVVMSGEIDMEMDDTIVHLQAGDVLVQRGTIHNWVNKGTEPCVIAFVLISSDSNTAVG